jgi:hypothetical protein
MQNLEERINRLKPYFEGFERYNNGWVVKVQFNPKWGAYPSEDKTISVAKSDERADEYFYYAKADVVDVEKIFDLIEETIEMNKTVALKIKLMSEKMKELQDIFTTNSYKKLQTLRFAMDEVKEDKPKRKYTKRKKVAQDEKETVKTAFIPVKDKASKKEDDKTENKVIKEKVLKASSLTEKEINDLKG